MVSTSVGRRLAVDVHDLAGEVDHPHLDNSRSVVHGNLVGTIRLRRRLRHLDNEQHVSGTGMRVAKKSGRRAAAAPATLSPRSHSRQSSLRASTANHGRSLTVTRKSTSLPVRRAVARRDQRRRAEDAQARTRARRASSITARAGLFAGGGAPATARQRRSPSTWMHPYCVIGVIGVEKGARVPEDATSHWSRMACLCRARPVCDHRCGLHRPAETSGDHGERAGSAAAASDASRCGGPSPE